MIGVRFGAMCMIVLGGMLVSSAAEAAQACDKRLSRTCRPAATQINPAASNAQRAATATRPRRIARHRHGVRHAQSAKPARRTAETSAPPPIVSRSPEPSPAVRRFAEFVSPRSLAANPVEDLHKPRMNVSEFSGQTAYPLVDRMDREPAVTLDDRERAAVRDTTEAPEPVAATRVADQPMSAAAPAEASAPLSTEPSSRSGERDPSEGSTSWVRIVFLTWGGLLTLGSALRLLIG